jgi:pimeloyl-ACP methyl ester carboxylesterase
MRRRSLLASMLVVLAVAACSNPPTTDVLREEAVLIGGELGSLSATKVTGRTGPGSEYEIWMPEEWTGRLVLYAHGYVDPALPVGFPELPAELVALRDALLAEGAAVAYSSYSEHGYAVRDGVQRTHQLLGLFTRHFGRPDRTYLMGHSLGGMVVLKMAEQYRQYDGALALCSFVGGGLMQAEYIANVRVLFDAFYPELSAALIPGDAVNVPRGLVFGTISAGIVAAITEEFDDDPEAALNKLVSFATIDQIQLPFDPLLDPLLDAGQIVQQIVGSLLGALYYNVVGGHDLYGRTHRRSPFDNVGTVYRGPYLDDAARSLLNVVVDRYAATPDAVNYLLRWYQPTGTLRMPLLTMHTTLDPDVPFAHQAVYAAIVETAGTSHLLDQRSFGRYGHCAFEADEILEAFGALLAWVELGAAP